jgi:hypothetical protein
MSYKERLRAGMPGECHSSICESMQFLYVEMHLRVSIRHSAQCGATHKLATPSPLNNCLEILLFIARKATQIYQLPLPTLYFDFDQEAMATAIASRSQPASKDRLEPGSYPLRTAAYPLAIPSEASPEGVAKEWTSQFNAALSGAEISNIKTLFMKESYWRDQLCLSWDFHTFAGPREIAEFLENEKHVRIKTLSLDTSSPLRSPAPSALDIRGKVPCVNFFLHVETDIGNGVGIAKLVQDSEDGGRWKAFTLLTTLRELKGYEELVGERRPTGVGHGGQFGRKSWQDIVNEHMEFNTEDPAVLIVGKL